MNRCIKSEKCGFFNDLLKDMPPIAKKLKEWFCEKDSERCARYMVKQKLLKGFTPSNENTLGVIESTVNLMHPNDYEKAELIIMSLHKSKV